MPASVVTVPDVPTKCTPPWRISWRMQCTASKFWMRASTSATIASNPSGSKPAWPKRSASVTTPTGSEIVPISCGPQPSAGASRIQAISVEPPPISNSSARRPMPWVRPASSSNGAQLSSASSASSRAEMISIGSPVSRLTLARNSRPLLARRQASVAIARSPRTGRRARRWAQPCSAPIARSIATSHSRPELCSPSPSRTMRLKLSTTRNPSGVGAATSSRQLLVPRSSAA